MNKIINIAIVEDQQENVDVLKFYFDQKKDRFHIRYISKTGDEARQMLTNDIIDLALLDVDLGDETIFDVLNDIAGRRPSYPLIFITAHGTFENAVRAIRYSCMDFITKPIDFEELSTTLDRVSKINNNSNEEKVKVLLDILKTNVIQPSRIGIVLPNGILRFLDCNEILSFSAYDVSTRIQTHSGESLKSVRNLGYYSNLLESHNKFIRIHKSTIINKEKVSKFSPKHRLITMSNGEEFEIAKRRMTEVSNFLR